MPNAPEVFEGRQVELEWLTSRLETARPTILWSPPGLGKTGLVLRALAGLGFERGVILSAEELGSTFLPTLHRSLAEAAGVKIRRADRAVPASDLVADVVALLERVDAPVVLEDLHSLPDATTDALLIGVGRHCRRARLVISTRRRPAHDDLTERTLVLEPLADAAIERVVRRLRPAIDTERLATIVATSAGSPRLARQNALGLDVHRSIVESLSERQRKLVQALGEIDRPVDLAASDVPEEEVVGLIERGFLERWGDGLRVVPNLRPLVRASVLDKQAARREALRLASTDDRPALRFEVVRLAVALADHDRVARVLQDELRSFLALGYAEALFDVLVPDNERRPPARLLSSCFTIADWMRGGRSLRWACAEPEPPASEDKLVWCRLLAHGGAVDRAKERAEAMAATLASGRARADAALLHADIVSWSGDASSAVRLLEAMGPFEGALAVHRELRLAVALARSGDAARAETVARAAFRDWERLEPADQLATRAALVPALLATSSFRGLERLLGTAELPAGAPATEVFALLATTVERGLVENARGALERARVFAEGSLSLTFAVRYNELRLRTLLGPFAGLEEAARAAIADDRMAAVRDFVAYLYAAGAAIAVTCGSRVDWALSSSIVDGEGNLLVARAWHAILAQRRGEAAILPSVARCTAETRIAGGRLAIEKQLLDGELDGAERDLDASIALAREEGLAVEELALLALRVDVRLCTGSGARARTESAARELDVLARSIGSRRFEVEAELALWAVSTERPAARLLAIVAETESPVARRRASALLARPADLDRVDQKVVAAMAALSEARSVVVVDVDAKRVRLPSGKEVDLGASPLSLKLLQTLFRSGGEATKRSLAEQVWDLRVYHPHRDDKRLQVAIHRLRHAIEEDPSRPALVVRREDTYRLTVPILLGRVT